MTRFAELPPCAKKELWVILALRHASGVGARRGRAVVEAFGSALGAVEACLSSASAWSQRNVVSARAAAAFASSSWRAKAALEWSALQQTDCSFLFWGDDNYPEPLRHIPDPPLLLYYKGDPTLLHGPAVAVVGARNCTREGIAVSAFFSRDLSRAGVAIISGMARGIDRAAYLAGMEGPGRSIAVLGTGIDVVYPSCNADLYARLCMDGLVLSEFPPGSQAQPSHFPVRNRLISGLSQGVLVVEAAGRSGSLITARLALEQSREVFAVPGHTTAGVSAGCRELIRRGAKPVFNADDILQELAPLLTLEARRALARRTEEKASAPVKELHVNAQNSAVPVFPEGKLPWVAPPSPSKKKCPAPVKPSTRRSPAVAPAAPPLPLSPEESRIVDGLDNKQMHIDVLALRLDMDVAKLSALLTMLEVRGRVRRAPGMLYSLPDSSG